MNEHQRCLELAAASIDYRLSPDEQYALRTHLALCGDCNATVRGIRDDATRLAAAPHPAAPASVRDAVIRATGRRSGRAPGMRWAILAAALAAFLVAGSFVAGSVVDRLRGHDLPGPAPTDQQAPRPTATAGFVSGWNDLGDVSDAFGARTVMSVMPRPDGGLVAFGQDHVSALPVVWVSDDGVDWSETRQPKGVFSDSIPTSGALGGPGMLLIASAVSTQAAQRAIWESTDGRTWIESSDPSAKLQTNATDLVMTSGPAGVIVWRPSGTVWVSTDGATWTPGDIGHPGITDMVVDADGFVAVGQSGSNAFLVTSADGLSWGAARQQPAAAGTQVGIEQSSGGTEAIWIGEQLWQRTGNGWHAVAGATVPKVPDANAIIGGQTDLAAIGSVTGGDTYRAWTWPGSGDWASARQTAEAGSAAPVVVAVASHGTGWYVLTRRGSTLHGWILAP